MVVKAAPCWETMLMGWAGRKMLTARSVSAGTLRAAGSETATAPAGMVMDGRPLKVRALAEASWISSFGGGEGDVWRPLCGGARCRSGW